MKIKEMVFLLWVLVACANAQTQQNTGYVQQIVSAATGGTAEALLRVGIGFLTLLPFMLFGGGLFLAGLVFLQYIGIDIIGWTIELFRFFFDNLFLLMRWTLASPENLISMVILFIVFWAVLLFGGPKI